LDVGVGDGKRLVDIVDDLCCALYGIEVSQQWLKWLQVWG